MDDSGRRLNLLAVALAVATAFVLILVPLGTEKARSVNLDGSERVEVSEVRFTTLAGQEGIGSLPILITPVAISAAPLATGNTGRQRRWRRGCAALLTGLCPLSGFSVGVFYVPTAAAMWWAASRSRPEPKPG
ncbi:MAG: hypothetical protein ACT4OM_08955 [Actinomycetota bacterium]